MLNYAALFKTPYISERYEGITYEWFETAISVEATKEWFEKVKKSGVHAVVASTGD